MFKLAKMSLGNRALIALITIFAMVFGVITLGSLKQELIPSIEFPQITVVSAMPGASPAVVDKQVSEPLEAALNAVEGLESSTSTSRSGFSTINLAFTYGTNLDRARNQIDRAISNVASRLPDGVQPQPIAGSIADFPIVFMAVSSDQDLAALNTDLARIAVPKLMKIDGVRSADVTGANSQHIQILPNPAKMTAAGVTVGSIADALKNNGTLIPVGSLTTDGTTLSIQAGSPVDSIDAVKALPLAVTGPATGPGAAPAGPAEGSGAAPTIESVATVALADDPTTSITRTNGEATLALSITKKPDADTVTLSQEIAAAMPELTASMGNNTKFVTVLDQAPFIEKSIHDLTVEGLLGLGFAVVVILIFLMSVRSTLVTAISIPLSLLVTFIGLWATGYSLNILTLGALTIAIGRVVDDSIVVIENIKRHLSYGEDKKTAILAAIREVAAAITASTLTTVAVFLPIAFVGSLAGELFRPFALTVTFALLASLLVSLTIVPVLAYWFLKSPAPADSAMLLDDAGAPLGGKALLRAVEEKERSSWLQRGYLPILAKTQKHPVVTLIAGGIVLAATLAMTPLLPTNLLGDTGQNSLSIQQDLPAGTSLEVTNEAAKKVETALDGIDGITDVQVTIGNASGGFAALLSSGASSASFQVITDPDADQVALQDTVRSTVEGVKDAGKISLGAQGGGFGMSSSVDITVKATTGEELQQASDTLVKAMTGLPGAQSVTSNLGGSQPVVQVSVDRAKAVAAGLDEQQITGLLAATVSPIPGGTVRIDTTDYRVQIGLGTQFDSVAALAAAQIPTAAGMVPLSDVATVAEVQTPLTVTSSNGQRTATVSVTPEGDALGSLSSEVANKLDATTLPAGTIATIGGAATQQAESFQQLGLAMLAAIAIVYVIMVATFKSLIQPLILLVSIPFAATGAIALLLITGIPLGLPSLIGLLMLVGIVVTNAIVLIDLINQYREPSGDRPAMNVADAIEHGARQRLRPILMTALATIFALTPMALGVTGSGGFISQPLAVVVVGGLISSTALTLILVPVLYRLVEGRKERHDLMKALKVVHTPSGGAGGSGAKGSSGAKGGAGDSGAKGSKAGSEAKAGSGSDTKAGSSAGSPPQPAPEFQDWTTGAIPKVRGRRAATD
ncbi:putative transporter [Arthrobacter sp. PAMC 25486]|uniref:efflux RND transporter permease subunit n=1 Tax=Arthrobacter sp. PAMC 25486 TaxID=1494608 RepID=UPI000535A4B6|nr:efflux RND transporter permease subunit [Arthrobacter sp. PAMC 25486]AIY00977.1 putative transporter [Arthrobacter sp. PAMC 25486]